MSIKVKSPAPPVPILKNAPAAPVVYFDSAPAFGTLAGVVEIELSTRMLMPKPDGGIAADALCVAHLRCSPQAALALADALTRACDMMQGKSTEGSKPENRTH